ncbi:MAG: NAD(P)H-quinone oxidoreductase [Acidobacteria bacterium]|nr:NAD(P)H-quinone oxidoreductase [Acidobacteriota bacterium]
MRAVIFDRPGDELVLRLADVPSPEVRPGELLLRVAATALNRADLLQRQGKYPPPPGESDILGLECAGEVVEVGPGVDGWRRGDRAMALLAGGGYAEEVAVPAPCAMPVPARLSLVQAAAVPEAFLTVHLTVFRLAALSPGGTALIHGGGSGIGTAAIQMVKATGGRVIVTAGTPAKCRRCIELGADRAVDYRTEDFCAAALEATDGRGVDVVLDSIGAPYLERNLAALAVGGRLVLIALMGGAKVEADLATLMKRRLSLIGSTLRARPVHEKAELVASFGERFLPMLADGRLRPVIDRVLPIERVAEAHRAMAASEHFGKIVLTVTGA